MTQRTLFINSEVSSWFNRGVPNLIFHSDRFEHVTVPAIH